MRLRCIAPGCTRRAVHKHHVIYEQVVKRAGGNVKDERNLVPLCLRCHLNDQHQRIRPLPLRVLPDSVYEFALETLGAGPAYEELRRRYVGEDPRHEALLA